MSVGQLKPAAAFAIAFAVPLVHGESPMFVDDAGTLDKGRYKLEANWVSDGSLRVLEGAAGFAPIENLELEFGLAHARDQETDPSTRLNGVGFAAKWVPLQSEGGLSAGVKAFVDRVDIDDRLGSRYTNRASRLTGLASWRFASGQVAHLNLGRKWVEEDGTSDSANIWGLGFEQPLIESLQATFELFGAEGSEPNRQIGLRWEVADGLKLSAGVGRVDGRHFGRAGVAWEF